jgi:hypothetical protein
MRLRRAMNAEFIESAEPSGGISAQQQQRAQVQTDAHGRTTAERQKDFPCGQ